MPTYQLGAQYPYNLVKKLDSALRFLPRPADYLFLYFLGFYILLCCLKIDYRLAVVGALAFGFSTYLIIIIGVGHNAKAHAIAYLPLLLGGIVLTFRRQYIAGFSLTALAMALEVAANHYQMTYYFMLFVLVLGLVHLAYAIKMKQLTHYFKSVGLLVLAVALGIAANSTSLLATSEYAAWSTRGQSALTIEPDGSPRNISTGLDREYITQYSYGIAESLNIFVPRLFGGSNDEELGESSKVYKYLTDQGLPRARAMEFAGLRLYWGDQPGVAGPAYVGAIVFFLFILGIVLLEGKYKWWLLGGALLSLLLSWGRNFGLLTNFMIDYFPMYNKFRAVSSAQVILELCMPVLAVLALSESFSPRLGLKRKLRSLKVAFFIVAGLGILIFLMKGFFSFEGPNDAAYLQYFGDELMAMIRRDREAVFINDTIRSLVFVVLAALVLWLYLKGKMGRNLAFAGLGLLILVDLVGVDRRYVNEGDFVRKRDMAEPFSPTTVDKEIMEDKGIFRVYDPSEGLNGARTSYFHQSIGGYHAAKPAAIQDLFDFHIYKNNLEVLNMLNVKYVVQRDEDGEAYAAINPDANGNAWFVEKLATVPDANHEIMALDSVDTQSMAVVNSELFPDKESRIFKKDSTSRIALTSYTPNRLGYTSASGNNGLAVFSEMYYPHGWQAYIDGSQVPHYRVDYALRALEIPAGEHRIEFIFEPSVVQTGSKISLASSVLLALLILAGAVYKYKVANPKEEAA
jgi:hypothetical protein